MVEQRVEYRALKRVPGHKNGWTAPGATKEQVLDNDYDLRNAVATGATVVQWACRTVLARSRAQMREARQRGERLSPRVGAWEAVLV